MMDFLAKKQAVLNNEGERIGFEFLLIHYGGKEVSSKFPTNRISMISMRTLAEYGVRKVGEGKKVFLKVSFDSLLTGALELLDPQVMVYKLFPSDIEMSKNVYAKIITNIKQLQKKGAEFSVHHRSLSELPDVLQYTDIVEFSAEESEISDIVRLRNLGKKILISDVNSRELYDKFSRYADYLQGDYLESASTIDRFKFAPFLKSTILRLLVLLNTAQGPTELAKVIETDVGMSAKLLRFINSAFFALRRKITSIEETAVYFGLKNLRNFILVLAINDYATAENPVIWKRALVRAKLMEELSKIAYPELSSEAYLVGLFSLIDIILDEDIPSFLSEVNVDERVISAFTDPENPLAKLLRIVTLLEEEREDVLSSEPEELPLIKSVAKELKVPRDYLAEILIRSQVMADTIMHL